MSVQRLGGIAAVLMGMCGAVFVGCTLIAASASFGPAADVWPYVTADYALALAGLLGLAAIPAISEYVMHLSPGWMRWMNSIAVLSCALLAVLNIWQAEYEMISDDPAFSIPAISGHADPVSLRDGVGLLIEEFVARTPHGWIEVAGLGMWAVSVCWLALKGGLLPAGVAGTGMAAGVLSIFTAIGATIQAFPLQVLGAIGTYVVLPIWLMWVGFVLLANHDVRSRSMGDGGLTAPELLTSVREPVRRAERKRPLIRLWPS